MILFPFRYFLNPLGICIFFIYGCNSPSTKDAPVQQVLPLFALVSPSQTHIYFSNTLSEGLNTNVLMYEYFYNGGSVG
jgi:enediyne biosynthesis protein E4